MTNFIHAVQIIGLMQKTDSFSSHVRIDANAKLHANDWICYLANGDISVLCCCFLLKIKCKHSGNLAGS
jgi:hypothetical protein